MERVAIQQVEEDCIEQDAGHLREVLTGLAVAGFTGKLGISVDKFHGVHTAKAAEFCRVARAVCADVAASVRGVRHVEVDADRHLDAARELHVRRTPTVLVVDAAGNVVGRAVGAPSRDAVLAAVTDAGRLPR